MPTRVLMGRGHLVFEPTFAVLIAVSLLFALIVIEVPVGLALAGSGFAGLWVMGSADQILPQAGALPFTATASWALIVIPLYLLLGSLLANAGIGQAIFSAVHRVVHRVPGGLGVASIGATAMFSGISGSSAADVSAFGRVATDGMARHGYDRAYAAAIAAAAGAFAALIPPSIAFVLYGMLADVSIAALIFAGLVPGIVSCMVLACYVVVNDVVRRRRHATAEPEPVVTGPADVVEEPPFGGTHGAVRDLAGLFYVVVIFAIVVGGLYGGYFTTAEAAAFGAVAALVIAVCDLRFRREPVLTTVHRSMRDAIGSSSMVFLLLVGGAIFGRMLVVSGAPRDLARWVAELGLSDGAVLALMLLVLIPLGMFLDGLTIMLITVPLMTPIVQSSDYSPVWFGVLVIKVIEVGLITPPVGLNAFVIAGVASVKVDEVFRRLMPFVALDLVLTAFFFAFPDIVLWLPEASGLI